MRELQDEGAPIPVRNFVSTCPEWLEVRAVIHLFDHELDALDEGERQAVTLAEELQADLILIDEKRGREVALKRGLPVTGTLGVVFRASEKGIVDFKETLSRLKESGFYVAPDLERLFIENYEQRQENHS